jgi:dehydrogenase/reductase SDR family protein 12
MSVSSSQSPRDVFAYLARFSNAASWDPGVSAGKDITPGPPGLGSTYRLQVRFLGLTVPLDYRIEEIDEPKRVVLRAENAMVRSTDVIEVKGAPNGGSTVTYDATLTPKGISAAFAPLIGVMFRRIGDRAAAGLAAALGS